MNQKWKGFRKYILKIVGVVLFLFLVFTNIKISTISESELVQGELQLGILQIELIESSYALPIGVGCDVWPQCSTGGYVCAYFRHADNTVTLCMMDIVVT